MDQSLKAMKHRGYIFNITKNIFEFKKVRDTESTCTKVASKESLQGLVILKVPNELAVESLETQHNCCFTDWLYSNTWTCDLEETKELS